MQLTRIVPLVSGLVAALATPALAQADAASSLRADNGHLAFAALGHTLTLPLPSWVPEDAVGTLEETSSVRLTDLGGQLHLELYPRGEGEAFWSVHYGVHLVSRDNPMLAQFRSTIIDIYASTCRPDSVALFQLEPDNGDQLPPLGIVCGAYLDLPGYAGKGEVMIASFAKTEAGMAMAYQEWRSDAFDATDSTSWPIPAELIEGRFEQFKTGLTLQRAD